jgi:hypothetical protein
MIKKLQLFVILPLMGLFMTGSAVPQGTVIKCKDCTRFPGTTCWPEADWQDLADPGCISDGTEPCAPNLGRKYTITWTGASIIERPTERVLWCRGATAAYQVCNHGNVLYTYYKGCPPVFYPPVSGKGIFLAEASQGTATPVLYQWCGTGGLVTNPSNQQIRIGIVLPYYAAVACGDSGDRSSKVEATRKCR